MRNAEFREQLHSDITHHTGGERKNVTEQKISIFEQRVVYTTNESINCR